MKKIFDLIVGTCAEIALLSPLVLVALMARLAPKGQALYLSDRVGATTPFSK